jgi:hypothetical protein
MMESLRKTLKVALRAVPAAILVDGTLNQIKSSCKDCKIVLALISDDYLSKAMDLNLDDWLFGLKNNNQIHILPILLEECFYEGTDYEDILSNRDPLKDNENVSKAIKKIAMDFRKEKDNILDRLSKGSVAGPVVQESTFSIAQSFYHLNYEKQKNEIDQFYTDSGGKFPTVNVFLLRGTNKCGHELLVRSFINIEGFKADLKRLPLPYYAPTENQIWPLVKDTLELGRDQLNPQAIAKKIIDKLKITNIVLQFNDIHVDRANFLKAINKFWHELNQFIKDQGESPPNHFFIFVNDRKNKDEYKVEDFLPSENTTDLESLVQLLTPISPILKKDLSQWVTALKRDTNPELKNFSKKLRPKITDILPDDTSTMFVVDVIKKVLEVTQLDNQIGTIEKITDLWQEE